MSLAVIGLFAFLGQRAVQGCQWAFLLGLTLYALDGVIFLLIQDWAGVGFHAFALMMIMRGYLAARRLPSPSASRPAVLRRDEREAATSRPL